MFLFISQKDESRKRPMPDDESEVPSFTIEQTKRTRQNLSTQISTNSNQQQTSNSIDCDEEFSQNKFFFFIFFIKQQKK